MNKEEFYLSLVQQANLKAEEVLREPERQDYESWRRLPAKEKKRKPYMPDMARRCAVTEDLLIGYMRTYKMLKPEAEALSLPKVL